MWPKGAEGLGVGRKTGGSSGNSWMRRLRLVWYSVYLFVFLCVCVYFICCVSVVRRRNTIITIIIIIMCVIMRVIMFLYITEENGSSLDFFFFSSFLFLSRTRFLSWEGRSGMINVRNWN